MFLFAYIIMNWVLIFLFFWLLLLLTIYYLAYVQRTDWGWGIASFFHYFNIFTIYDFLLVYKSSMLVYFHDFLVYKNVYYIFIIFKISFKYIKVRCWDYSPNSFFCWCIFNIFLYIKMCTLFNINHLYLKKKKNKKKLQNLFKIVEEKNLKKTKKL